MKKAELEYLNKLIPIEITNIEWNEPSFHLRTTKFIFNALVEWRIMVGLGSYVGCYNQGVESYFENLIGIDISKISVQNQHSIDPVFIMSNGQELEFFSTSNGPENWIFSIMDENVIIESNESSR